MRRWVLFIVLVCTPLVSRAEFFPSEPMTVVGLQGRPLAHSSVIVSNTLGVPVTVYNDPNGAAFPGVVPPTGVLQFFADPGQYIVNVTGEGLTRVWRTTVTFGVGPSAGMISIDRTAEALSTTTSAPPIGPSCLQNTTCTLSFDPDTPNYITLDFILPSYPVSLKSALLSWHTLGVNGVVIWALNWCVYGPGEVFCDPTSAPNKRTFTSNESSSPIGRIDLLVLGQDWPTDDWAPNKHVIVSVSREANNQFDTSIALAQLENIRLELNK